MVMIAVAAVVVVALAAMVLADRSRRAAQARAAEAEDRMHAAQARLGALTVRVEELVAALAAAEEAATAATAAAGGPIPPALTQADDETGLLGEAYFVITLDRLLAAAKRHLRPVAVVLLEVADPTGGPVDASAVAQLLVGTLRDADIACRLEGQACFGVVLEDTPENGAVWSVERFRRAMTHRGGAVLRAGIACYPAHAFDAGELRSRAAGALEAARQWRQDRIEVATASEV